MEPIEFQATVYKVQTMADGGIRVTLDLSETAIYQMALLAECQRHQAVLDITCKTIENKNHAVPTRSQRKSKRKAREESGTD